MEDDGALCVFPEGFENRQGEPLPLIVRKSDGGYGYPATDLATVRDRTGRLGATRLVYVVGAEQSLHLRLVFAVAALAGYLPETDAAVHVGFGLVLGTDGKKLASRSGGSERLVDLLNEGIERAAAAMKERSSDLSPERQAAVAHALGIGAVKYADLSTERTRDYVFDWDRMLAFEGNTGPYLQYAHARIRSIFRRAQVPPPAPGALPAARRAPGACAGPAAAAASRRRSRRRRRPTARPSSAPTSSTWPPRSPTFYEACRVLVDDEAVRTSRLGLCDLTARVLEQGLSLLGMEAPEQM